MDVWDESNTQFARMTGRESMYRIRWIPLHPHPPSVYVKDKFKQLFMNNSLLHVAFGDTIFWPYLLYVAFLASVCNQRL